MLPVTVNTIQYPCFDDVLLEPVFSRVRSRQDVDISVNFLGVKLALPVINSNMDTIAGPALCLALQSYGAMGSLHRFCSIEENMKAFMRSSASYPCPNIHPYPSNIETPESWVKRQPIVSVGIGEKELERAKILRVAGAEIFMLDVAHAANIAVVDMFNTLKRNLPDAKFVVGNFGTQEEVAQFLRHAEEKPDAICVGIGGGSMCLTRVVTGVGIPTLASILDCAGICEDLGMQMMVNGGLRNSGDIVKALAAGADLVMLGSMFAGTDEASGRSCIPAGRSIDSICIGNDCGASYCVGDHKEYRGSASLKSYEVQGKTASWRAPEGDSTWVKKKGPVVNVLDGINGGIRSAFSYLDASNINELRAHAKFNYVTSNTVSENKAHGK